MSEDAGAAGGTGGIPAGGPAGGESQQGGGGDNPAWGELLNVLPSQLHGVVKPHLQKWDQGVQQRFQQVHSQYEPWQGIADQGVTPDDVMQALGILQTINDDPQRVYEALAEHLGVGADEQGGAGEEEEFSGNEEYQDPRYDELQGQFQNMAQIMLAQHEQAVAEEEDQALDSHLSELTEKFGEYDERYVLAMMDTGMSGEDAVQQYQQLISQTAGQINRPPAPKILNPGGGLPSQAVNPSELTDKGRRDLVAQMLSAAAQQRQG